MCLFSFYFFLLSGHGRDRIKRSFADAYAPHVIAPRVRREVRPVRPLVFH